MLRRGGAPAGAFDAESLYLAVLDEPRGQPLAPGRVVGDRDSFVTAAGLVDKPA
ncbi:hypothetical protein ABT279_06900 [Amycolatopsis sp. NPDC000673]|uniref:hypothetical protein n=1 Tax=unclassified Amycolatopsis TaxID=2618356 RepID=UPI00332A6B6F